MALVVDTEKNKHEYKWIRYIRNRISKNKNFICLISGPTGSGKSWTALSIASLLDKNFNPKRIIFGLKGLMQLINSGEENLKAGSVIVWDEFQIGASSRDWQSMVNKLLNSLLSTFRHKRFILILTSPYADFIDSSCRKLLHAEFEVTSIDYDSQKTKLKPLAIQYNSRYRKFFYKYLRVSTEKGVAPVKSWSVPKPTKWLVEEYERMKTEFTSDLNKSIEHELKQIEYRKKDGRKALTDKQMQILEALSKHKGDIDKVPEELGISISTAYFHVSQARKKGYNWQEFTEKGVKS